MDFCGMDFDKNHNIFVAGQVGVDRVLKSAYDIGMPKEAPVDSVRNGDRTSKNIVQFLFCVSQDFRKQF